MLAFAGVAARAENLQVFHIVLPAFDAGEVVVNLHHIGVVMLVATGANPRLLGTAGRNAFCNA